MCIKSKTILYYSSAPTILQSSGGILRPLVNPETLKTLFFVDVADNLTVSDFAVLGEILYMVSVYFENINYALRKLMNTRVLFQHMLKHYRKYPTAWGVGYLCTFQAVLKK